MTTFTINDVIFKPLSVQGADPAALQNFVNALNQNPYANAVFTQAVQRGDFVFELIDHTTLASKGAGALFSNDRGTKPFIDRESKFAIKLDKDWFMPHGSDAATFARSQNIGTALGMVMHETDHSNRQALFDEAFKISSTSPSAYRPDLTGAARVAASVDLTMKAEAAGWYADLQTLRKELELGHISQGQFDARTRYDERPGEGSIAGKLLQVESQGKALGLSGNALTDYVSDHGKGAVPSDYIARYTASYAPGMDPQEVRAYLAYALNDPGQVKTFTEEVGPDGTYISNATYNNGDQITTVDTGLTCRVTQTDSAHNHADYASRTTTYDTQGRQESIDVMMDDGSRSTTQYDPSGAESWSVIGTHFDAQGRNDATNVYVDDGSLGVYAYDVNNSQSWGTILTHYDALGRNDSVNHWMDDGSSGVYQNDVSGAQSWAVIGTHYDAQGRNDATNHWMDDGSLGVYAIDVNGSQSWSTIMTHYDALGRNDAVNHWMDDGSSGVYQYDVSGAQSWSAIGTHYDAQGRNDATNHWMDDGSLGVYAYDVNNSQSWSTIMTHYDALGRNDSTNHWMDDGSHGLYQHDVGNTGSWSVINTHYDAQGREDWANVLMDDGRRTTVEHDQDGSQSWSRIESQFGANGRAEHATTYYDDGSRVVVGHDYYKFGEHQVVSYDVFGRAHLVGSMLDRTPGLVFPSGGGVKSFDGTVLATPQSPNASSGPVWIPTDTGVICGFIETPWGTYVDCA